MLINLTPNYVKVQKIPHKRIVNNVLRQQNTLKFPQPGNNIRGLNILRAGYNAMSLIGCGLAKMQ